MYTVCMYLWNEKKLVVLVRVLYEEIVSAIKNFLN